MEINKIYAENCLDTMARMPEGFIDLTVTSPPYDNLRDYNGYVFDFEAIAKELYRVTKDGGVVVWVVGDQTVNGSETGTSFRQALFFMDCGFNLHDTMIFYGNKPPNSSNRYQNNFEYMFVFSKRKPKTTNLIKEKSSQNKTTLDRKKYKSNSYYQIGRGNERKAKLKKHNDTKVKDNIWFYRLGFSGDDKTKHPAVFPEKLAADHIYSWSNEGDLVYDPFTGSGTTPKMAHLANRNWIGSEISQENVDLANKRIDPYLRQQRLF